MTTTHTSTYSQNQKRFTFNILDSLKVEVRLNENPYGIPLDFLFGMAARKNKKRAFLFVSRILGKHIPVKPVTSLLSGALLGMRIMEIIYGISARNKDQVIRAMLFDENADEVYRSLSKKGFDLPEETLFIGFAETATALGHSTFDVFNNAHYIHTTREKINEIKPSINFKEEHSHATDQACFVNRELLEGTGPIVLVDDEITTGKTALNIIESLHAQYPRRQYIVASLLDWRSEADRQKYKDLEKRLGISIQSVSLCAGEIDVDGDPVEKEKEWKYESAVRPALPSIHRINLHTYSHFKKIPDISCTSVNSSGQVNDTPYSGMTGRFSGLSAGKRADIDHYTEAIGRLLAETRSAGKALCLGTGEFMYLPMKIAAAMGENLFYQSTTRSPIHRVNQQGYAVKSGFAFNCPEDHTITNYFYNIEYKQYDDIYIFFERTVDEKSLDQLLAQLKKTGAANLYTVFMN
ncbi:adenine/guanine phosphoribosyltransferase [Peribacillus saganii]|uniref:Adenine/guanine phosphoribosyltransferase n=1 Tax=Peribacillus saganii TaxID=2303992 RepID=A0A372LND4_9BACI|nr:phosphoribosyltransferase family protein [Peribacillus saganii]RFU69026.1 adenine/guanine phosphoribosyltransferase [Peribacillus saganii]